MGNEPHASDQLWERGWDGHERAQRARLARMTLEQKLDWLEEAHRFVLGLRPEARPADAKRGEDTRG